MAGEPIRLRADLALAGRTPGCAASLQGKEDSVEFLVEFEVNVPDRTPESEVQDREHAEASAAAKLVDEGHLVRVWKRRVASGESKILGLYRADSETELNGLLGALPLYEWMQIAVTPLEPHPNDPGGVTRQEPAITNQLPDPRLTRVYRLEATLAQPLDLGATAQGHRRIVPLTGGTFTGPALNGTLLPGASADWQTILPDGTALGDVRYTLLTDAGDLLYVQSRGVRHGSAEVLARLGRGEDVDAREYTFRTSTQILTAAPDLDWLNKGVFISVAGRQAAGVIYETYLVA
jgi:muconolactone delta-isomerase